MAPMATGMIQMAYAQPVPQPIDPGTSSHAPAIRSIDDHLSVQAIIRSYQVS